MALVPPGVVTVTSTKPAACAGATALSWVADTNVTKVDAVAPNFTLAPDTKLVPLIVTVLAPVVGPAIGLTLVTAGVATTTPQLGNLKLETCVNQLKAPSNCRYSW